ncbi:MAG: DNA (cytosine-5-)-methyltransferase [Actinobacteria bacterium]|nr:DNA (cytosine-5-)-methyltransferase [Actinomycetota bacterium]
MNVGSLFAGIGGFDLGLERAGFEIEWQVELDPYCRAVLERRFPKASTFEDVREVGAANLAAVDVVCGGFPCQDLSGAGKGAGIDGARSGLWTEFARIVRELRPRYVLVENVPALLTGKGKRWDRAPIGRVLGDLAEAGYDAEWASLSAREFGAPHLRRRVWIVAYPALHIPDAERQRTGQLEVHRGRRQGRQASVAPEPALLRQEDRADRPENTRAHRHDLADVRRRGCPGSNGGPTEPSRSPGRGRRRRSPGCRAGGGTDPWAVEPRVGRVADGVPNRVDRLAALGNALIPQIPEWIGIRILEYEAAAMSAAYLDASRDAVCKGASPRFRHRSARPKPGSRR